MKARAVAIAVAGIALPVAGLIMMVRSCSRAAVSGEVIVAGEHGWRASLSRCRSGELESFTGVDLGRDGDRKTVVRAMLDPDRGPIVELTAPTSGAPLRLTAASCPGLVVEVRTTGRDHDGAAIVDGRVVARCAPADGPAIQLDAWWRRCSTSDD